jgi:hypothetical protein
MTETPARFRKRPVEIEARQLLGSDDGQPAREIAAWCGGWLGSTFREPKAMLVIPTLEGDMVARPGDWVVRGVKGEFYPVRADIFAETYVPAAAVPAGPAPATDRAALRQQIIEALHDARRNGLGGMTEAEAVEHMADAALSRLLATTDRAVLSTKLWAVAEHHIVAEWICCEPLDPKHDLCAKGYAALGMAKTLLVDSPEAWNPSAPLLDAVLAMLPASIDQAAVLRETADTVEAMNEGCGQGKPCASCDARADAADALRDIARRMADETQPEAREVIHGCPPDGSGLTPCCGRTPFELPLTDRISSEAPITCRTAPAAPAQPDGEA